VEKLNAASPTGIGITKALVYSVGILHISYVMGSIPLRTVIFSVGFRRPMYEIKTGIFKIMLLAVCVLAMVHKL
jgi:hypothetical protein